MLDRRDFLAASSALAALTVAGCTPQGSGSDSGTSDSAKAKALYDRMLERMIRTSPELATSLGRDTGPNAELRSRLSDLSDEGRQRSFRIWKEALPELRLVDRSRLPARERVWLDTAIWMAERIQALAAFPFGVLGGYPLPYVITQLTGSYLEVPRLLENDHPLDSVSDCEAYLSRLDNLARNILHDVKKCASDSSLNVIPPAFILDKALVQTRQLLGHGAGGSPLRAAFLRRVEDKRFPGDWSRRLDAILERRVFPALNRQIETLAALRNKSAPISLSDLPDGEAYFDACLGYHTTTSLTADEIHRVGLDQVRELTAELEPLLRERGLTRGSVGSRLAQFGKIRRFLYPDSDEGRAELLADLNRQVSAARARAAPYFPPLPKGAMEIRRVPPETELGATRGYAVPPSPDGSRPGAFYINLADMAIWPKWALPTLTYHEAVPGHLLQLSISMQNENVPLLQRIIPIGAHAEGWALYAEQLAGEIGMYESWPDGRVGMLQSLLHRSARLAAETGLHSRGWSRAQAIRYLSDTVGISAALAENEVDRYFVWPGQGCGYKVGHNGFVDAREKAKAALGPRFDLKAFHGAVLEHGAMTLQTLHAVVADWVGIQARA